MRTKTSIEWAFFHGWGFHAQAWEKFEKCFLPSVQAQRFDRGYWGNFSEVKDFVSTETTKIVVTHSLGLHWVPERVMERANYLIIFGGFEAFPIQDPQILQKMKGSLSEDPVKLLKEFYKNCFSPQVVSWSITKPAHAEFLQDDLSFLERSKLYVTKLSKIKKILIFHGTADRIVPFGEAEKLHQHLPQSLLFPIENAGHAVQITFAEKCAEEIKRCIL